jgi:DNA-binding XRE family transcriptional regulator
MITLEKISTSIRETRAALNLSQDEFGKLVGLSRATVIKLENKPGKVKAVALFQVIPVVNRTLGDLTLN